MPLYPSLITILLVFLSIIDNDEITTFVTKFIHLNIFPYILSYLFVIKWLLNLHLSPRQRHLILRRMYAIGRLELVPINTTHVHQTGNAALNMIMDVKWRQITVVAARRRHQVSSCFSSSYQIAFLCGNEEKTEHEKPIWMLFRSSFYNRRVEDGANIIYQNFNFPFFYSNTWWLSLKHWDKLKF